MRKKGWRQGWTKGSITVFLCLALGGMLTVYSIALRSARLSAARVRLASASEQSMFSAFSRYDRKLFLRFGLLFLPAGDGSGGLQPGRLLPGIEADAEKILRPAGGGTDLLHMGRPGASVTSYTLATDSGNSPVKRQIRLALKEEMAGDAAETLKNQLGAAQTQLDGMKKKKSEYDAGGFEKAYESNLGKTPDETKQNLPAADVSEADRKAAEGIAIPEGYQDPVKSVKQAKGMGILRLAVPAGKTISEASVGAGELPSERTLHQGMGLLPPEQKSADGRLITTEYAVRTLPSFTDEGSGEGLRYRLEYLIGGKRSDQENLKQVLNRLLAIREAANFAYLSTDAEKRAESLAAANAVCAAFLSPELAPVAAVVIRGVWAYAESIYDLRTLLSGDKVPLVKTAGTWKISISSLPSALSGKSSGGKAGSAGLDYRGYLRILLAADNQADSRLIDMIEHTMRTDEAEPNFRIDACLDSLGVEIMSRADGRELRTERYYAYETDEK